MFKYMVVEFTLLFAHEVFGGYQVIALARASLDRTNEDTAGFVYFIDFRRNLLQGLPYLA